MDLIIKGTSKCNYRCTFCSSTVLSDDHNDVLDIAYIDRFVQRFADTLNTVIVNGGDPLMMPVQYYWDILEILNKYGCEAKLSFTSNL